MIDLQCRRQYFGQSGSIGVATHFGVTPFFFKCKKFNRSSIASEITVLMLTLSVNGSLMIASNESKLQRYLIHIHELGLNSFLLSLSLQWRANRFWEADDRDFHIYLRDRRLTGSEYISRVWQCTLDSHLYDILKGTRLKTAMSWEEGFKLLAVLLIRRYAIYSNI